MNSYGVFLVSQLFLLSAPPTPCPAPAATPGSHVISEIPFQRQEREYCGPAALAMVFGYYKVVIPQEKLAGEIYQKKLDGALNLDMLISARRHGFAAEAPEGSLSLLKASLRRDIPVIVMVRAGTSPERYHYLIVYGYDDAADKLSIYSGGTEPGTVSYRDFDDKWKATGRWMLIIEQKQDL